MRKILIGVMLLVAACRSVPQDVVIANVDSQAYLTAFEDIKAKVLANVGNGNAPSDNERIAIAAKWADAMHQVMVARDKIQVFLDKSGKDSDLSTGYSISTQILADIDANTNVIFENWQAFFYKLQEGEYDNGREEFVAMLQRDMERFTTLDQKFQEWINQFGDR